MSTNPFPGPQPYRASDRERFYGREELSYRLEDNVIANRCVTVYGPSGAGKTSVMQASVLPRLVEFHEISVVRVDSWPEGEAPSAWLASAMYAELGFGAQPEDLSAADAIFAAAKRVARRSSRLLVVYLDQMEQLLYANRSPDEVDAFFECVHALVELPLRNVRVVLSLREDYLGRFRDRLRDLMRLLSHGFRVGPLTVAELCEAVCKAAATGNPPQTWQTEEMRALMLQVRVPGQAESDEAEGQAAYAQIVCRALFDVRAGGDTNAGGAKAEPILRGYLDTTLDALGPLRASAERLLEDHLITADGTRTLRTEKELLRILPAEELSPVLKALEGAAILHAEEHQGSRYFEIGHDWLARRVHEQRKARERELEQRRREKEQQDALLKAQEEAEAKLAVERTKRRNLRIITVVSIALAVGAGAQGFFAWTQKQEAIAAEGRATAAQKLAEEKADLAHDAKILAGFRELKSLGQLGWAMKLLWRVKQPGQRRNWVALASDALNQNALRATLIGHKGPLSVAAFSPDGKRVLTASIDGTARVWSADGMGDPVVLEVDLPSLPEDSILAAAWTPDGRRVVTGSMDGTGRVWSADGKGPPVVLAGHTARIITVTVSPDGKRVVTGSKDGTALLYAADWSQAPSVLAASTAPLKSASPLTTAIFHPDGVRVVTGSEDGTVIAWDADGSGKQQVLARSNNASVVSLTSSLDGNWLLTTSTDQIARIFRADGKGQAVSLKNVYHAAVSPDSKLVAVASTDQATVQVWTIDGKGQPIVFPHTHPVTFVAFPPDGKYLATVSTDKIVRVFSLDRPGAPLELRGHDAPIRSLMWSPDGRQIVTAASDPNNASVDRSAKVWSTEPLKSMLRAQYGGHLFHAAFIGRDCEQVVSAYDDNIARLWWLDGSKATIEFQGHEGWVANAALSPDCKRVVAASFDKTARVWKADQPTEPPLVLKGHDAEVRFAAFSPNDNGARIVTVSDDKTARVWKADGTGTPVILKGHEDWLTSAAWSPDGTRIVTTSLDHTARVWNADGNEARVVFRDHVNDVLSAAWSFDSKRIVTASKDRTARVWNADGTGTPIVRAHADTVLAAAFSPNGTRIATSMGDKMVQVWNADGTGTPITLEVPAPVISIQFRGEHSIITVDAENTAKTWMIHVGELQKLLPKADADCLPPQVLARTLDAASRDAILEYSQCERDHQRTRLPLLEGLSQ